MLIEELKYKIQEKVGIFHIIISFFLIKYIVMIKK